MLELDSRYNFTNDIMELAYPLDKIFITQHFGERPDVYKIFKLNGHDGIDLRTRFPDSPNGKRIVLAAAAGVVKKVADQGTKGYGKYIKLQHSDGSETIYGHLETWYVTSGQNVDKGEKIGLSDNTGFSSAPHLHFGYRPPNYDRANGCNGYIDPLPFLQTNPIPTTNELHLSPLALIKKKNESAVYIYGYDKMWYGLNNMNILQILTGPYNKAAVTNVDELPSNLSSEIISIV